IGVGVWALSPRRATTWALQAIGLCVGVYALTAMDLYGPHVLFRLHALAEAFLPAVFLHLALLFPVRRMRLWPAMVSECEAVALDDTASEADRQTAFAELAGVVANIEEWTRKAISYIRS